MTFLQPLLLAALPLAALPIIIHLINQRRYQTLPWGAMMFLLAANRMSRGYARIRQWLILLFRTLAIAGLIFAIGRPLAGGLLGLTAGGRADTTIVVLDRSPSMQQIGAEAGLSKLETGKRQLAQALSMLASNRWVLIENATTGAREIESPEALLELPTVGPADASADLPAMLEVAYDYVRENQPGRTEIWICSDLRQNDWDDKGGRWRTLRDSFGELPQSVRFRLLAYPDGPRDNTAIQVTEARRRETGDGAELLVSLRLTREGNADEPVALPVRFNIDGARSEINVEFEGPVYEIKDHRIPIDASRASGWGTVSIPADENPADNDFYFVFGKQQERKTLIVSEDPYSVTPLQLAASIPPAPEIACSAEVIARGQLVNIEFETLSLIVWNDSLPDESEAMFLTPFLRRGGRILFVAPPESGGSDEFLGVRWGQWTPVAEAVAVETWRSDADLLANSQSGASLPVGELTVRRFREIQGETIPLARLHGGKPLLARVPTDRGGVYFLTTSVAQADSTLAANGVALYVAVQRALAAGAAGMGQTRQLVAGGEADDDDVWTAVAASPDALSTAFRQHAGVYAADEKLLAINRSTAEDQAPVLESDRVAELFDGLDFSRVDDRAGALTGIVQEIWRVFLFAMMLALLVEAGLCMPRKSDGNKKSSVGASRRQPGTPG